jgi:hypothetical protein
MINIPVKMGQFHSIIGVGVNKDGLSLLDKRGVENLLVLRPVLNRIQNRFGSILVRGEFGDFKKSKGVNVLQGLEISDVLGIETLVIAQEANHHVRLLRIIDNRGVNYLWDLYCEGAAK